MARKLKTSAPCITTLGAAILDGISVLRDDLGNEMREWYDNMSENLQGGDKGSQVDEAANTLENCEDPDIPETISEISVSFTEMHKGGKKGDPRWLRRDNAISSINAGKDEAEAYVAELEEIIGALPDDAEDDTEITIRDEQMSLGDANTLKDEVQQLVDDLDNLISEAENVEFPGMYG